MAANDLPTRGIFLQQLQPVDVDGPRECHICFSDAETMVALHGSHVFGDACTRYWLAINNTCPMCRVVLFRQDEVLTDDNDDDGNNNNNDDDPDNDYIGGAGFRRRTQQGIYICLDNDRSNLDNLNHLANRRGLHYPLPHFEPANGASVWLRYIDARANLYRRNQLVADRNHYRDYTPGRFTFSYGYIQPGRDQDLAVNAGHLFAQLDKLYLFSLIEDNARLDRRPTAACHPLATQVYRMMRDILRRRDGTEQTVAQLNRRIGRRFRDSFADDLDQLPGGMLVYANELSRCIARLHGGQDVMLRGTVSLRRR